MRLTTWELGREQRTTSDGGDGGTRPKYESAGLFVLRLLSPRYAEFRLVGQRSLSCCHHVWCTSDGSSQFTDLQVRTTLHSYYAHIIVPSSSYVEDPIWQSKFTAIWCSCLGVFLVLSLPSLVHAFKHGRALTGFFGVSEGHGRRYSAVISEEKTSPSPSQPPQYPSRSRKTATYRDVCASIPRWSVPYLELNAGQSTYPTHTHPFLSHG